MFDIFFERNKGSTDDLLNPLGLARASLQRPNSLSNNDPGGIPKENKNERLTCSQQWEKFIDWLVETSLSYLRVVVLLGFVFILFQAKHILADMPEVQNTLSILTFITLFWLVIEYIEAHTSLPIKKYIKRFLDRFL